MRVLLMILACATSAHASEIRIRNGADVAIVRQDGPASKTRIETKPGSTRLTRQSGGDSAVVLQNGSP